MHKTKKGNWIIPREEFDEIKAKLFRDGKEAGIAVGREAAKKEFTTAREVAVTNLINSAGQGFDAIAHAIMAAVKH